MQLLAYVASERSNLKRSHGNDTPDSLPLPSNSVIPILVYIFLQYYINSRVFL